MELRELTKTEFDNYALKHPLGSFQQTSSWGRFMEGDKFHAYYVGAFIKDIIVGASLLLSYEYKKRKIRFFYAPRGFLIDYKNEELLKEFTKEIKDFIIKKQGILLKIDPYILIRDRNSNGEIISGGVYNDFIKNNLENADFIKVDDKIQAKWLSRINLKDKSSNDIFDNFSSKAKQTIRKNERLGFKVRELDFKELNKFLDIINETSKKYNTITPTETFYRELKQAFNKNLKLMEVYLKKDETINNIDNMILDANNEKKQRIDNYHNSKMTTEYFIDKEFEYQEEIKRLKNLKEYFSKLNDTTSLGIYMFITIGNEVTLLNGGILTEYAKLDASYTMHYEMIKYAIEEEYKYYNLYEIGNVTDPNNKLKNSFTYKKNFGGEVIELIGEYDLLIDPKHINIAKKFFPEYLGVKTMFK